MNDFSEKTNAALAEKGWTITGTELLPQVYDGDLCLRIGQQGYLLQCGSFPHPCPLTFIEVLDLAGTR